MRKILMRMLILCLLIGITGLSTAAAETAGNRAELMETIQDFVEKGEKKFSFTCTKGVLDMWKDRDFREGFLPSVGILGSRSTMTSEGGSHRIELNQLVYITGAKILGYYRSGQQGKLSDREKETLETALNIAGQAEGTELEKEVFIHDELCRRIHYSNDDVADNDDDCAVGALLDGRANCDGFSDAFYLIGRLAGLNIRYFTGTGISAEGKTADHMWNVIRIQGQWVMVDLTWDANQAGREGGNIYQWFNKGAVSMMEDHDWSDTVNEWMNLCQADWPELSPMGR